MSEVGGGIFGHALLWAVQKSLRSYNILQCSFKEKMQKCIIYIEAHKSYGSLEIIRSVYTE